MEPPDVSPQHVVSLLESDPEPTPEVMNTEPSPADTQDAPSEHAVSLPEPTPGPTLEETSSEASTAQTQDAQSDVSLEH